MHAHHMFRHPFLLVIVAGVAIEVAWYLLVWRRSYPWREALASLGVFILRIPAKFVHLLVVAPVAYFVWAHRVATVPLDTWWGLALLFLGEEFTYCERRLKSAGSGPRTSRTTRPSKSISAARFVSERRTFCREAGCITCRSSCSASIHWP